MTELEALCTWNKLSNLQRHALLNGLGGGYSSGYSNAVDWNKIPPRVQQDLLKLDWNFMLGGKLNQ